MSKWNGINQLDSVQLVQGAIDTELKAHSAISIQQARRASLWLNNKAVQCYMVKQGCIDKTKLFHETYLFYASFRLLCYFAF